MASKCTGRKVAKLTKHRQIHNHSDICQYTLLTNRVNKISKAIEDINNIADKLDLIDLSGFTSRLDTVRERTSKLEVILKMKYIMNYEISRTLHPVTLERTFFSYECGTFIKSADL